MLHRRITLPLLRLLLAVLAFVAGIAPAASTDPGPAQTARLVAAANVFLGRLTEVQRSQIRFRFDPGSTASAASFKGGINGRMSFVGERYGTAVWSNYPVSDVPRPGLQMGSLTATQRQAAMDMLQAALSPQGYRKVLEIMGSDDALKKQGNPFASGADVYTLGIFGTPSATEPWMLQFGGHHLGLNITVAGPHGVMTPTLTGAQPAVYSVMGKTVRTLAAENDKAFVLLDALDPQQRAKAVLDYEVKDLVLGPGHAGETLPPEGLKASAMNEQQRGLLQDLIGEWANIVNAAYAAPRLAQIKAGLESAGFFLAMRPAGCGGCPQSPQTVDKSVREAVTVRASL